MKHYLIFLTAMLFAFSCSEEETPDGKGELVINGKRYKMSKMQGQPYLAIDHSSFQLFVSNNNLKITNSGSVIGVKGSNINYISFWFDRSLITTEPITGTFGPDDTDMIVLIGYDAVSKQSDIFLDDPETGEVSIIKKGTDYSVTYTGQIDGMDVSLTYEGKIHVLPE
jgi:hypothetical protein